MLRFPPPVQLAFHHLNMTLAVAEVLSPNKPNQSKVTWAINIDTKGKKIKIMITIMIIGMMMKGI